MTAISTTSLRIKPAHWWPAFGLLAIVLLVPLFTTEIPPLLDYPNHLARMEILAHAPGDPILSRMYRAEWQIVPNIGIDLTMPILLRIMPLAVAGKIFIGLALLLPLKGVVALHRALLRQYSYWPLAAGLVVYNRLLFAGFLNFLIGIGLALLAAALWEALRNRKAVARVATAFGAAIVIFFCHLIALAFYGLLLLSLELSRAYRLRRLEIGKLALIIVPFVVPAMLYLNAPIGQASSAGGGIADAIKNYYWALSASYNGLKLYGLAGPFLTYNRTLDEIAAGGLAVTLGLLALYRRLRYANGPIGAITLLLVAYPFIPFFLMQTAWVDQRLPIMAGFLLFAGTEADIRSRRAAGFVAALFAVLIVGRTAEIARVWSLHDAEIADFRRVIAPVGAGDRVLVVQAERNGDPTAMVNNPDSVRAMRNNDSSMHLPALLVIERKAFWPLLFTAPTKQPVRVQPAYEAISLPEGELPWVGGLADPGPEALRWAPYLTGWEKKFDWVLLLHPGDVPNADHLLPNRLKPMGSDQSAMLYKIRK
jgi:hypothetical protein